MVVRVWGALISPVHALWDLPHMLYGKVSLESMLTGSGASSAREGVGCAALARCAQLLGWLQIATPWFTR